MNKIAVVFWSGTGNTQAMADQIVVGAKQSGAEVSVFTSAQFSADKMDDFDAIAFGCSSMGDEVLEEDEFDPMFNQCKSKLKDKKIALFGSYGWGDGEWMRNWEATCKECGAILVCDSVICVEFPDSDAKKACQNLGKLLV